MTSVYRARIPFFSVIICAYNRAKLLPRALDSLLAQTETDWEAIIVDDGSTDDTVRVVREYIARDDRFRYLYHNNRGTGLTRNAGLLASCGLFATFLDSDDEYLPGHLATRREILHSYPEVDLLHGGVEIVGNPYVPDKNDTSRTIHLAECVIGGTFVVRRDRALALNGFGSMRYADDTDFFERAENAGYVIGETNAPTYRYYRDTPDSLCNTVMGE